MEARVKLALSFRCFSMRVNLASRESYYAPVCMVKKKTFSWIASVMIPEKEAAIKERSITEMKGVKKESNSHQDLREMTRN